MKHQDSRDERLSADSDDASLRMQAWLNERQRPRATPVRRFASVFAVLAVFAVGLYLLADYSGLGNRLNAKTQGLLNPAATAIALQSPQVPPRRQTADPQQVAQQPNPIQPATPTSARPAEPQPQPQPQPLADCIKSANLIDENVLACRYGTLPRERSRAPSSGMVSAKYLAEYNADQARRDAAPAQRKARHLVEKAWIERWGGGGSFLAEWHVLNNRIDGSSVCSNHRKGSINYRECRKAAKVHFRERCRSWAKRWAQDGQDKSKRMEQRYCSAADGFSPMG